MSVLEISNFSLSYQKDQKIVNDVSFSVERGEIVGLLGQHGCGKTSLLRSCAGILDFSGGEIRINGRSITEFPIECKRRLGFIPENPVLYDNLTGIQYLDFIADIYEIGDSERKRLTMEYADVLELGGVLMDPIGSYDTRAKRRLVWAGTMLHEPSLLLLDEPFMRLDRREAAGARNLIKRAVSHGAAVLLTTHDLDSAAKVCTRFVFLKQGWLFLDEPAAALVKNRKLDEIYAEVATYEE